MNYFERICCPCRWLDKLGLAALRGVHVVIRQSFFHGHYALVDDSINPNTVGYNVSVF